MWERAFFLQVYTKALTHKEGHFKIFNPCLSVIILLENFMEFDLWNNQPLR